MNERHPLAELREQAQAHPGHPCLVARTGEGRVELSRASTWNYAVKVANLLTEECDIGPGDGVRIALPPHWQSAGLLLGLWLAGGYLNQSAKPEVFTIAAVGQPADAVTALDLWGGPYTGLLPSGVLDLGRDVRSQPDVWLQPRRLELPVTAVVDAQGHLLDFGSLCTGHTPADTRIAVVSDSDTTMLTMAFIRAVVCAASGATAVFCPASQRDSAQVEEGVDIWW